MPIVTARTYVLFVLLFAILAGNAVASDEAAVAGQPTTVLILGTPHLKELDGPIDSAATDAVIRRLQRFAPDVIAVECIAPEVLGDMEQRGGFYAEVAEMFAGKYLAAGRSVQKALGLTRAAAHERADAMLRTMVREHATRRELVAYLLAAYNYDSALLQWSYLPEAERIGTPALATETVAQLNNGLASRSEDVVIALELARRLGLQRVYPVDDQTDAIVFQQLEAAHPGELDKLEVHPETVASRKSEIYAQSRRLLQSGQHDGGALLNAYEYLNSAEYADKDVDLQWGRYMRTKLTSGVDRGRLAQWESRNLLIAAHLRQTSALYPGKRVILLIGAAHKPFLDRCLSQMRDIKLVQFSALLNME